MWRDPGAVFPLLMMDKETISVIPLKSRADIAQIVDLHYLAFAHNLKGNIGRKFIADYYGKIFESARGIILVASDPNGKVAGFLAGATDKHAIFDISFYCYSLYLAFLQLIFCPANLKSMFRYAKRQRLNKSQQCDAELLTIAVSVDYQNKGLGGRLVKAFEEFLKQKGVKKYEVFTDNEKNTAYVFYEKVGFQFAWDVIFMKAKSAVYQKNLG